MSTTYYTLEHRAGYGRDDHMADEIIARAARELGMGTQHIIAQHCGFASHPVPMGSIDVRLTGKGAKRRMLAALRAAHREVPWADCLIVVVTRRVRTVRGEDRWEWRTGRADDPWDRRLAQKLATVPTYRQITEERTERGWVEVSR